MEGVVRGEVGTQGWARSRRALKIRTRALDYILKAVGSHQEFEADKGWFIEDLL